MTKVRIDINFGKITKNREFKFWQFVLVFMGMIALMFAIVDIYVKWQFAIGS